MSKYLERFKFILNRFKHSLGFLFLILLGIIALWTLGAAAYSVYHYLILDASTHAKVDSWNFADAEDDLVAVDAAYSFQVNQQTYSGHTTFVDTLFRNSIAGEKHLEEMSQKEWTVWYNSGDPSVSTLYKSFPWRSVIKALVVGAILGYFVLLIRST